MCDFQPYNGVEDWEGVGLFDGSRRIGPPSSGCVVICVSFGLSFDVSAYDSCTRRGISLLERLSRF